MPIVAGVDGCPAGWICICEDRQTGSLTSHIYRTATELIEQVPQPAVMMIDIPIGLPPLGSRACDIAARALVGSRRSSVFPAPIRPAIAAQTRLQASAITQNADGRRVAAQAWGIYQKVRDVDVLLSANPAVQNRVFEVHPEMSFWQMKGGKPGDEMQFSKKKPSGRAERQQLIAQNFDAHAFANVQRKYTRAQATNDDIADAFAALWTARRKLLNQATAIPANPPLDDCGLRMEIWY